MSQLQATQPVETPVDTARAPTKVPEALSVDTDTAIVPPKTELPVPSKPPVVNTLAVPGAEAANDALATIAQEIEQQAATLIADKIATMNAQGAGIDTTGLAVDVKITRNEATAKSHTCGPNCAHCSATAEKKPEEAAPPVAAQPVAAPATEQTSAEVKPEIAPVAQELALAATPATTVTPPGMAVGQVAAANQNKMRIGA